MNGAKVILWDFDGTLGYRSGRWSGVLAGVANEQGSTKHLTKESFHPFLREGFPWHRPEIPHLHLATAELWWTEVENVLAKAYMSVGFSHVQATDYAKLAHYKYLEPSGWFLFDDVVPALSKLSNMGWSHMILSNHVPELDQLVGCIGLGSQISYVFTSATIGYEKPHPEAFRIALAALGEYRQVWMIGDNYAADIAGAEAVGIPAILVRSSSSTANRFCESLLDVAFYLE